MLFSISDYCDLNNNPMYFSKTLTNRSYENDQMKSKTKQ